jgi:hypothetical protein
MKIKILAIVLLVLLSFGLQQLVATQPGGGGTPTGHCPCYTVGQVISQGGWYQGGFYYFVVETYIGGCQIRQDWYKNGAWFQYSIYAGGCNCDCGVPAPADPPKD